MISRQTQHLTLIIYSGKFSHGNHYTINIYIFVFKLLFHLNLMMYGKEIF